MPNVALLRQTLTHIEANPQTWDQTTFRCNTGMCFAGWAAELEGGTWYTDASNPVLADYLVATPEDPADDVVRLVHNDARVILAADRAMRLLGLDYFQAEELFDGANTLDELRGYVDDLCAVPAA
jgi:hypothetical protein